MSAHAHLTVAHGIGRVAIGGLCLIAPQVLERRWLGAQHDHTSLLMQGIGARDVGIGTGLAAAASDPAAVRPWLLAGIVSDAVDMTATLVRRHRLPRRGVVALSTMALPSIAWQAWLLLRVAQPPAEAPGPLRPSPVP